MSLTLPDGVLGMADRSEEWADWVESLPRLVDDLAREWGLGLDGIAMHGFCALVVPVCADDVPSVLKISFPDDDTAHEHLALRTWAGHGSVRLLRADPRRRAMLLERLSDKKLDDVDLDQACEVVAGLYQRLHVPAGEQFPALSAWTARWEERLGALGADAPVPRRLVAHARSLAHDLAGDPDTDGTLLHGDLHYLNVLAASREPWLAIDPKPMSGDPHLEPAPMLWNRWQEALDTGDARAAVLRRLDVILDVAGLDEDRCRAWMIVRLVAFALEQWDDAHRAHRAGDLDAQAAADDLITTAVAIAKAMQAD